MGASSSVAKKRRSAHGDSVGSLVILGMVFPLRPSVLELGDRLNLVQGLRGRECVENLELESMVSAPADLVMRGDCMTPSALLHFSCWDIRFTSEGVSECERCFFEGSRGGSSRDKRVGEEEVL